MNIVAILGQKKKQTQMFLEDGTRIPVSLVNVSGNIVVSLKTKEKNGYNSIQLGFGEPQFLREVRYADSDVSSMPTLGTIINPTDIFKLGDIVDVTGISKGKGYAGVVKRHHFKGGPRTHGQSDRERAPGSIGQTTTPGRVYRGKRMAGRMGHERVTVKNLKIVDVGKDYVAVKGLVPGGINSFLTIRKRGEDKKFVPLFSGSEKFSDSAVAREVSNKKIATTEIQKLNETQKKEKEEVKDAS